MPDLLPPARVLKSEHTIRYEIQVWRKGGCCEAHPSPNWYPAKGFRGILADPNTSQDYAEVLLERMRAESPKALYRLAEIESVEKVSQRIVNKTPCPKDTNGDGDCGQPACPFCSVGWN